LTFKNIPVLWNAIKSENIKTIIQNVNNKIQESKSIAKVLSKIGALEIIQLKSGRIYNYYYVEGTISSPKGLKNISLQISNKEYKIPFQVIDDSYQFKLIKKLDQETEIKNPQLNIISSESSLHENLSAFHLPDNDILSKQELYDYYLELESEYIQTYDLNKCEKYITFLILIYGDNKERVEYTEKSIAELTYPSTYIQQVIFIDSDVLENDIKGLKFDYAICLSQGDAIHTLTFSEINNLINNSELRIDLMYTDYDYLDDNHKRINPQKLPGYGPEVLKSNEYLTKSIFIQKNILLSKFIKIIANQTKNHPLDISEININHVKHFPRISKHISQPLSRKVKTEKKGEKIKSEDSVTIIIPLKTTWTFFYNVYIALNSIQFILTLISFLLTINRMRQQQPRLFLT